MRYNLKGKYPVMANWLIINRLENGKYRIKETMSEDYYEMDEEMYHFLTSLDGDTDPYEVMPDCGVDVDELLTMLEEDLLIRTEGRTLLSEFGVYMRTIFIPRKNSTNSIVPVIFNALLLFGWLPILVGGVVIFLSSGVDMNWNIFHMLIAYIVSLIIGMLLHEVAHVLACLTYGGHFFEVGLLWQYFFPGAYVLIDPHSVKSKLKRIQINAAGIEMNLLLAGLSLMIVPLFPEWSAGLFCSSINNFFLAIFNLTFIAGFDGASIIGEIISIPDGISGVKELLINSMGTPWKDMDINRKAAIITCVILLLFQVLLPVFFINTTWILMEAFL